MSKWSSAYRDSRWQKKRLEVMERDGWTCQSCNAAGAGVTLNVHHAYYEAGRAPWDYGDETLVTWCEDCHQARHAQMRDIVVGMCHTTKDVFDGLHGIVMAKSGLLSLCGSSGYSADRLVSLLKQAISADKNGGAA